VPAGPINQRLTQKVVTQLVQSRKYTVLDREFMADIQDELDRIRMGEMPISEMAKLGQKLSADYLLVGTIGRMEIEERPFTVKLTGYRGLTRRGRVSIDYRVQEVANGKVAWSGEASVDFSEETSDDAFGSSGADGMDGIIDQAADQLVTEILESSHPIRIVKVGPGGSVRGARIR
jgi:curli biogenesis system outer membrane secretion channel CsgG